MVESADAGQEECRQKFGRKGPTGIYQRRMVHERRG